MSKHGVSFGVSDSTCITASECIAATSSTNGADSEESTVVWTGVVYASFVSTKAVLYCIGDGAWPDLEMITGTTHGESIVLPDSDWA